MTAPAMRITVDQYHMMIAEGIIPSGSPYELLDGYVVRKDRARLGSNPLSHDPLHVMAVNLLTRLAARIDGKTSHMQVQLPITLNALYEPEPDASILRGIPEDYRKRLAAPAEVSCLVEAAHSSLARDQETKLAAYAAAGIPQYLILNLQANVILIHADPDPAAGTYRAVTTAVAGQTVTLLLPDNQRISILASDVLP